MKDLHTDLVIRILNTYIQLILAKTNTKKQTDKKHARSLATIASTFTVEASHNHKKIKA